MVAEGKETLFTCKDFAERMDHSLLRPAFEDKDYERFVEQVLKYRFGAAHIAPCYLARLISDVARSGIRVGIPVGFPFGNTATSVKVREITYAKELGAREFDVMINICALKSRRSKYVLDELRSCAQAGEEMGRRVILECHYLSDDEKRLACELAAAAGMEYVKTSTGYAPTGATLEDVKLLRASIPETMKVKAAGGIRDLEFALALIRAGAERLGVSRGHLLVDEFKLNYPNGIEL